MRKIIIRVVIAAVILLAGIGVFQWHNYQQKVEYRKEALLYFKEEDYSKTISYLGQALKLQSVFAGKLDLDMTCYLAESHYQLKEYDEAEKIYDKLINNDSKNAQYYILKGECLAKSGDAKAAVKVYEQGWNSTNDTDFLESRKIMIMLSNIFKKESNRAANRRPVLCTERLLFMRRRRSTIGRMRQLKNM